MPIRRKPSGDRVAGLLAGRPGVLIRRVEPQVVPALPWIPGGTAYSDAVRYGRATPSRVAEPFAVLIARYGRLFQLVAQTQADASTPQDLALPWAADPDIGVEKVLVPFMRQAGLCIRDAQS
jgi:hypothetical protein